MLRILTRVGALVLSLAGCSGVTAQGTVDPTGGSDGFSQGGGAGIANQTAGASGALGMADTGGSSTVGTGETSTSLDCAVPGCCAPLQFEPSRSRAYWVDGQLMLYLVVTAADGSKAPVKFDAQVSVSGVTRTCLQSNSVSGGGFADVECPAMPVTDLACGGALSIQVRLHGAKDDSVTFKPLCDQVEFGPSATWNTTVTCPSCPTGYISWGAACDHPSISKCGNPTGGDTHCGAFTSLPCTCRSLSTGERVWNCAVC